MYTSRLATSMPVTLQTEPGRVNGRGRLLQHARAFRCHAAQAPTMLEGVRQGAERNRKGRPVGRISCCRERPWPLAQARSGDEGRLVGAVAQKSSYFCFFCSFCVCVCVCVAGWGGVGWTCGGVGVGWGAGRPAQLPLSHGRKGYLVNVNHAAVPARVCQVPACRAEEDGRQRLAVRQPGGMQPAGCKDAYPSALHGAASLAQQRNTATLPVRRAGPAGGTPALLRTPLAQDTFAAGLPPGAGLA